MKTKNAVLGIIILLFFGSAIASATDTEAYNYAKNELNSQLEEIVNHVPFNDLYNAYTSNEVQVSFHVNALGELTQLEVSGDNKELTNWTLLAINREQIRVNPILKGHSYKVKLSFKDGSKPIY